MDVHGSISIPVGRGAEAFAAISSEDGAKYFRDIGRYATYEKNGSRVGVTYATMFGTVRQDMVVGPRHITFRGSAPMGVTFGGSWTWLSDEISLEQTVFGVPQWARGLVQRRVTRALDDLKNVEKNL